MLVAEAKQQPSYIILPVRRKLCETFPQALPPRPQRPKNVNNPSRIWSNDRRSAPGTDTPPPVFGRLLECGRHGAVVPLVAAFACGPEARVLSRRYCLRLKPDSRLQTHLIVTAGTL